MAWQRLSQLYIVQSSAASDIFKTCCPQVLHGASLSHAFQPWERSPPGRVEEVQRGQQAGESDQPVHEIEGCFSIAGQLARCRDLGKQARGSAGFCRMRGACAHNRFSPAPFSASFVAVPKI